MSSGLPLIITKDSNSGHMDFCKDKDSVLWIKATKMEQADRRFFADGNMQPIPELDSLRTQMRQAFESGKLLHSKALRNSDEIIKNWSWDETGKKIISFLEDK
jgi:hypothetical protein